MKAESCGATWQRRGPMASWDHLHIGTVLYTAGMALLENEFHQTADKLHSRAGKLLTVLAPHFPTQKNNLAFN